MDQTRRAAKLSNWTEFAMGQPSETRTVHIDRPGGRVHNTLELKASHIAPHHMVLRSRHAPPAASAQTAREASPDAEDHTAMDPDEAAYAEEAREASPEAAPPPADRDYVPTNSDDVLGQL